MTWEVFEENRPAILAAVKALMANPKSRRRFRLAALYEKRTSDLVAEMFGTAHGPVVVWLDAEYGGESTHLAGVRLHGRDIAPLTGDPAQRFTIRGKSRSYVVFGAHFATRTYPGDDLVFK
jgi:hypothetical protein